MSWAVFTMWAQSDYSAEVTSIRFSISPTIAAEPVKSDSSFEVSAPDRILYPVYPEQGDNIGTLTIPALKLELPVIQGTGVEELKKGVGHFAQSVLPGEEDNCVLSGHRETVFRQMGSLKIGDLLILQTSAGIFTYQIYGTRIVHADDKTVIVPTENAILTMTTCYPFNAPGYYPDRYIVSAVLVKSE
ncbi:MAG: class D sortase [Syntrophomonadaceae bacterium]|nr:class D sortase [Syntrophomonadaceae bacterium]